MSQDLEQANGWDLLRTNWPGLLVFAIVLGFAHWPTLAYLEDAWRNEPDYSHGYLVPLLAGLLCWHRLDSFPGMRSSASWGGLSLIVLSIVMRILSWMGHVEFMDAWSLIPLLAGVVWVWFGLPALRWSLPALAFLLLMVPMPYRFESLLSWKLQGIATQMSTIFLRVLGQPAVIEGHVIWIGDQPLMVEQACSGMRIFIGVGALAFFWAAMVKRCWIDRFALLVIAVPLAVVVNAMRITVVGLLYGAFSGEASHRAIHDMSGILMIPLAFALLWIFKIYWELLYRPVDQLTTKDLVGGPAVA